MSGRAPAAPWRIDRATARRFLVWRQGLLRAPGVSPLRARLRGEAGTLAAIRWLEAVQIDPMTVVERNHHLVLRLRVGGYRPAHLEALLARAAIFEHFANARCALPVEDLPLFWPRMARARERLAHYRQKVASAVKHILAVLRERGPLPARAFETAERVHGYWDQDVAKTKATSLALEVLWEQGEIMLARREGNERHYDLPERVVPPAIWEAAQSSDPAGVRHALLRKYARALGLFDTGDFRFGWRRMPAAERRAWCEAEVRAGWLVPVEIDGVQRRYYAPAELVEAFLRVAPERAAPDVHFLPPLDNLLWRRERLADIFEFEYTWEAYVPVAKRRHGYYVMPVLEGDRLIGRMDPKLDRKRGVLVIQLLALEPGVRPGPQRVARLRRAVEAFAAFHGVADIEVRRLEPEGWRL